MLQGDLVPSGIINMDESLESIKNNRAYTNSILPPPPDVSVPLQLRIRRRGLVHGAPHKTGMGSVCAAGRSLNARFTVCLMAFRAGAVPTP